MMQRATIAADSEVLAELRAEAELQGLSFAALAGNLLADCAAELRRSRRPRVGVGHSGSGVARESVDREDLPAANG